jgi:hypothetical protein
MSHRTHQEGPDFYFFLQICLNGHNVSISAQVTLVCHLAWTTRFARRVMQFTLQRGTWVSSSILNVSLLF